MPLDSSTINTLFAAMLPPSLLQALSQPPGESPPPAAIAEAQDLLLGQLDALRPYVPALVHRWRMAEDAVRPPEAALPARYIPGTLVFADLSGFTALSAKLATNGRHGSEEISALINRIFAALLQAVDAHGGEVVKFGGDAITAFFSAELLGDDHAGLAAAAALALQDAMRDFAAVVTSGGVFRLRLRVTINSGRVFFAEVGDSQHRELIATGEAMKRVVQAQQYAAPSEIVVTPETLALLPAALTAPRFPGLSTLSGLAFQPWPPPSVTVPGLLEPWGETRPSGGADDLAALERLARRVLAFQPYIPRGLPYRLTQHGGEAGEFRPCSVLFADLSGFTNAMALLDESDGERAIAAVGELLNAGYVRTQETVDRFGGIINKVDMAADGDRLMALFGAPLAHEDDPARAVKTALELREVLRDIDRDTASLLRTWREIHDSDQILAETSHRIGLAGGTVFAGIVGTRDRHEYTVMGETVNLAARLFEFADPGDVLMPSLAYRAVQQLVEAEPLQPIRLKGFAQEIPVYHAVALRYANTAFAYDTPFVGRDEEIARLDEIARQALQPGGGGVVAVLGEAGIGKSRLADEVLGQTAATDPAVRIVREACQSYEQTQPYALIARIARRLLRLDPLATTGQPRAQAMAAEHQLNQLMPTSSRFIPLLGSLLEVPIAETPLTRSLSPEQRRDRINDLLIALCLAAARRQPTVLLVDGAQWIDASSQAVLERLAAELGTNLNVAELGASAAWLPPKSYPAPLLLLMVSRPTAERPAWETQPHSIVLHLAPFKRSDSEAMLAGLLGGNVPDELEPLIERSAGTPLYLEETVRYLLESRALYRNGGWHLSAPLEETTIPGQLEQLIVARLDQLADDTRALAQVAAVIGQRFSDRLLSRILPERPANQGTLRELVGAAILAPDASQPATYQFRQALIRDVAYNSLSFARRQALHAAVADAIETLYPDALDSQRIVLAQHYERADQPLRACEHYLAAAQQAQARYANREALALYEQALKLADQLPPGALPAERAAAMHEQAGDVFAITGDYERARQEYRTALGEGQAAGDAEYGGNHPAGTRGRAALQRKIGSTYENQANWPNALAWLADAERSIVAEKAREPRDDAPRIEHATILSAIGWVHFRQNEPGIAEDALRQALDQIADCAAVPQAVEEQARIFNRLGGVAWMRRDLPQARTYVEQSLAASKRSGDLVGQARLLNNLCILAESQGQAAESIAYGLQALELQEKIGNARDIAIAANNLGCAFYSNRDDDQARQYFALAADTAIEIRDDFHRQLSLSNLGRTLIRLDRLDEAGEAIRSSLTLAVGLSLDLEQLECYVALAELALARRDEADLAEAFQRAAALATDPNSEEYGRFQRLEARLELRVNNSQRARELLEASIALFIRLNKLAEAAVSRALLAELAGAAQL